MLLWKQGNRSDVRLELDQKAAMGHGLERAGDHSRHLSRLSAVPDPRTDRDWVANLSVMPKVDLGADDFSLDPVMDWSYTADGPATKTSTSFTAKYADIRNAWFMVEPQPGQPYAAHTLILNSSSPDDIVGLTVEARLEKTETYSAVDGLFNKFELAYMWNTAKELLTRRATFLKKDIYVYPLALTRGAEGSLPAWPPEAHGRR